MTVFLNPGLLYNMSVGPCMQVCVHVTASIRHAFVACLSAKHGVMLLLLPLLHVAEGYSPWAQNVHVFMHCH